MAQVQLLALLRVAFRQQVDGLQRGVVLYARIFKIDHHFCGIIPGREQREEILCRRKEQRTGQVVNLPAMLFG